MVVSGISSAANDNVDYYWRHLLTLGGNIKLHWPVLVHGPLRLLGPGGLSKVQEGSIHAILAALPRLTLDADGLPVSFDQADPDLPRAVEQVIDTGLLLIDDRDLSRPYQRPVMVMEPRPDGLLELDTLGNPTIGELLSRLTAGLEAIDWVLASGKESAMSVPRQARDGVA